MACLVKKADLCAQPRSNYRLPSTARGYLRTTTLPQYTCTTTSILHYYLYKKLCTEFATRRRRKKTWGRETARNILWERYAQKSLFCGKSLLVVVADGAPRHRRRRRDISQTVIPAVVEATRNESKLRGAHVYASPPQTLPQRQKSRFSATQTSRRGRY